MFYYVESGRLEEKLKAESELRKQVKQKIF